MTPSLLVLVMHGAGRYYIEPLLATGRLPFIRELATSGHQRYFRSELPLAAGAWVTLMTGEPVGVHGVLDYIDLDARQYDGMAGRHSSSSEYAGRTVQSVLSRAGRRVASIYLPMTTPPWPIDGRMISGFPLADERHPPTFPPELAATLPPFASDKLLTLRYAQRERLHEYLRTNLARVEDATAQACRDGFDVVLSCIPTPDIAHHYFWRPDDPQALEEIYRYYEQVDAAMQRIAAQAPDNATVVVLSDHGGRAAPPRLFAVNRWLVETGDLVLRRSPLAARTAITAANRAVRWAKRLRLNHVLARRIRGRLRRRVSAVTHNTAFVDWSRSRAYGLDFVCPLAGVEVNLQGRQAAGLVAPADYERVRCDIIERMRRVSDPETGAPIFVNVLPREAMFDGPHLARFPDVIGVLSDEYDVKGQVDLPVVGPNAGQWDYPFLGYHAQDSFFAARGPGIRHAALADAGGMVDIAPTLLTLAGVGVPDWMTGRPFRFSDAGDDGS